uniref:Protein kinase domain-containing protein n=1 Tax=Setaria digitata TaxID=48799 RepID=A0A915PIW6_9BILA
MALSPLHYIGSVLHVVQNYYPCGLPEKAIAQVLKNVLSIRCSHILLHSTGAVKLTGFRHCVFLRHNELTGTDNVLHDFDTEISDELLWLAPEIFKQDLYGYGLSSDVYSIGITICEMANGFPPFSDMDRLQVSFCQISMEYMQSSGLGLYSGFLIEQNSAYYLLPALALQFDLWVIFRCFSKKVKEQRQENVEHNQQCRQRRRFSESLHIITDNCLKPLPENRIIQPYEYLICVVVMKHRFRSNAIVFIRKSSTCRTVYSAEE